jgi:putative SOS response-associated peptidase YedK
MCGRFTVKTPVTESAELFEVDCFDPAADLGPRFNIAPTQPVAAIRRGAASDAAERRKELALLRWGLLPRWTEDATRLPTLINARAESLDRKPAFRDSLRDRRCLVVADGFYEWRAEGGGKQPYYVRLRSQQPVAFAGLWDRWSGGAEGPLDSCAIVTTDANDLLAPLHDRMPVILSPGDRELWLDPTVKLYAELEAMLQPFPSESLEVYPVDRRVNRPLFDEPRCVEPIDAILSRPDAWVGYAGPSEPAGATDREPQDKEDSRRSDSPQLDLL